MPFSVDLIHDSLSEAGVRLTTFQLRYPRMIHAEFMTHRMFSRNASSSRAIPVKRLIEDVVRDPAMPVFWGKNQPGMQAREEHDAPINRIGHNWNLTREEAWLLARDRAVELAEAYSTAGYHKQIVNRLLEPFAHINVVVTATEWDNYFNLRCHPDAQPEIKVLADMMRTAYETNRPIERDWHLPYVTEEELDEFGWTENAMVSAARCARTSYLTHERQPPERGKDEILAFKLHEDGHMSPFEHQARAHNEPQVFCANFRGWISHRIMVEHGIAQD